MAPVTIAEGIVDVGLDDTAAELKIERGQPPEAARLYREAERSSEDSYI